MKTNGLIQEFESALPRVFIIEPGAEKEQGCDDLAQKMRGDSDGAPTLICVWHDLSDRAYPDTGKADDGYRERINDGIATARWVKENAASPVTRVVLLFSPDFPTYLHGQQLVKASGDGIYYMCHGKKHLAEGSNADAEEVSRAVRGNMTDRARKAAGPAGTSDLPGQEGSDEKKSRLLESFREPPPATHAPGNKVYYRDPPPAPGFN